jgi:hypothetical protein
MRKAILLLAVFGLAGSLWAADNPFIGTWKLNVAKSKSAPIGRVPKSEIVKYVAQGDGSIKMTFDFVNQQGKANHQEWSAKWDGKNYYGLTARKIDSNHLIVVGQGISYRHTISEDGNTLSLEVKSEDEKRQPVTLELVYDKQ